MNIILEKLLNKYEVSEKDRYEIKQIFNFLTISKKQRLLENFETTFSNIIKLRKNYCLKQEIILSRTIKNIENRIKEMGEVKTLWEINKEIFTAVQV